MLRYVVNVNTQLQSRLATSLEHAESTVSPEKRLLGLKGLVGLTEEYGTPAPALMIESSRVMEAFIRAAREGETGEIKRLAMIGLANLCDENEGYLGLMDTPGLVEVMLEAARAGDTSDIKSCGLEGLLAMSFAPPNKLRMLNLEGAVEAMLRAALHGETPEIKTHGVRGLSNLACDPEGSLRVFKIEGVVDVALRTAQNETTSEMRRWGLTFLNNLCSSEAQEPKVLLFQTEGVMDIMLRAAVEGESKEMKRQGFIGFENLSFAQPNRVGLYEYEGVIDAILRAIQLGESAGIVETASKALFNLSKSTEVAEGLVERDNLLSVLKNLPFDANSILAIVYLHLAAAPRSRIALKADVGAMDHLCMLMSLDFRSKVAGAMALVILQSDDEDGQVQHHAEDEQQSRIDEPTTRAILEILVAAMTDQKALTGLWILHPPLLALRCLTTLKSDRSALGTEWLINLPLAIDMGLSRKHPIVVESALNCLLHYSLDPSTLLAVKAHKDSYVAAANKAFTEGDEHSAQWVKSKTVARNLLRVLGD